MRIARRSWIWAVPVLALALLAFGCGKGGGQGKINDDGMEIAGAPTAVVAKVGGQPITLGEVGWRCQMWMGGNVPQAQGVQNKRELQMRAINSLVDQAVLAQEATKRGVTVPDSVVDGIVQRWMAQFADATQKASQLNQMGVTEEQVRATFREGMLVRNFIGTAVADTIQVPEAEIAAFYQAHPEYFETTEVHARHILKLVPSGAPPESIEAKRAVMNGLLARVRAGEDFGALATAYSEDPQSAPKGGDLGFFNRGQMVAPFSDSAFSLPVGGVSDIVQTSYGFHIIKVEERRNEGTRPLDATVANSIGQFLRQQRVQKAVDDLTARLREKASVKMMVKV